MLNVIGTWVCIVLYSAWMYSMVRGQFSALWPQKVYFQPPPTTSTKAAKKTSFNGQLPVTTSFKGRNRSTSTFSTASSASACYTFHHLNPDQDCGDGNDLPMACQTSISQPCSHHASFSGPSSNAR